MANTWQGEFPWQNLQVDGYEWRPRWARSPPNGYGLYDMAGNVWEWTTDWYQDHGKIVKACCTPDNPRGGSPEASVDPQSPQIRMPTLVEAAGDPEIKEKLKKGHKANGKTFKVHPDGFSLVPYFTGKAKKPERKGFYYFTDDGDLACLRYDNWRVVFMEQRTQMTAAAG